MEEGQISDGKNSVEAVVKHDSGCIGKISTLTEHGIESVGSSASLGMGVLILFFNLILPGIGTLASACCIKAPVLLAEPADWRQQVERLRK